MHNCVIFIHNVFLTTPVVPTDPFAFMQTTLLDQLRRHVRSVHQSPDLHHDHRWRQERTRAISVHIPQS